MSFTAPVDRNVLRRMADALVHRGPDDEGLFCEGPIGLAHRRLSIIDLSSAGHQPMFTEDGALAIVFNGEVYNHAELRPDLESRGYVFRSGSDTEVVLNAIHCWGLEAALRRFIGMFAFAVWDLRSRELSLVRDRLGVKPLFYALSAKRVLFGSELKALYAHPEFSRELDLKGLGQFFSFGYTVGHNTIVRGACKVPAGHWVRFLGDGTARLGKYWSIDDVERGSFTGSYRQASEELATLCDSAFSYRLVADVPVGVFLSGGIDSTFLAATLRKRLGRDLEHITIGFPEPKYDETARAASIARQLGLRHTVRRVDAVEAGSLLSALQETWDEPFGDTSAIPTHIMCAEARRSVKVALSADGGDELFCGYGSYAAYAARYRRLRRFPLGFRRALAGVLERASSAGASSSRNVEKLVSLLRISDFPSLARVSYEKFAARRLPFDSGLSEEVLIAGTPFEQPVGPEDAHSIIDRLMRIDLKVFLVDDVLAKVDRASMSVSLETRDPFLDHRLVEFAFSLPVDYHWRPGIGKRMLREALAGSISPEILSAPKQGFSIPLREWVRGPWKPLIQEYLSRSIVRKVGVLDEKLVTRELDDFYRGGSGSVEKIVLMLNFQMWALRWYCQS